jgi:hypothetical protein
MSRDDDWLTDPVLGDFVCLDAEAARALARREAEIQRRVERPIRTRRVPWRWIAGAVVAIAVIAALSGIAALFGEIVASIVAGLGLVASIYMLWRTR